MNTRFLSACALLLGTLLPTSALAVRLSSGQVYFDRPPRLLGAATTFNAARVWGATYRFTLAVPEDAGEPLQRVTIAQRENVDEVAFDLDESRAFAGTGFRGRQPFNIASVTEEPASNAVTVVFDPPVPPGNTVTITLRPDRNPDFGGVYLFGVTAFPAGENSYGQFLGYGRLNFYDNGGHDFL
ncbi:DUF2808 domain-containing protein [Leptolyngbya sp. FACHB-261]|uniref:DUF2808 domain-containing protein n=1 Tax=Leptolyngbya sp. FACHB-261 TaxID=2692806 RepID=UPI00168609E7|nr:DUF2808 domain-containing protein [Leptolyngbya sp. FACHB-261]MBD2099922.1 DUF2808 domain-containing protein [Leptolyngbya sp. FACHB-261]